MIRARLRAARTAGVLLAGAAVALAPGAQADLPPSPWAVLGEHHPPTPALDPLGFCLPEDAAPELHAAGAAVARGDVAGARAAVAALESEPATRALAQAMLDVAVARLRTRRVAALSALEARLRSAEPAPLTACAWLEAADAALALERLPEAAAFARRAGLWLEATGATSRLERSARFAQAEALYASRSPRAPEAFAALAAGDDPVAHASQLRQLDLAIEGGEPPALDAYSAALERAVPDELTRWHWAPRVAELAAANDDYGLALDWLAGRRANLPASRQGALAAIREADLLKALEQPEASVQRLEAAQSDPAFGRVVRLARIREVALGVATVEREEQLRWLAEELAQSDGGLTLYTRAVQVEALSDEGRFTEAVEALTALVFARPPAEVVPDLPGRVDAALAVVAADTESLEACASLVRRLGGARNALIQTASVSEPFIRLARCYDRIGIAASAVETYRAVARRFGPKTAARVSLPLAHAAIDQGDLPLARASAEAQIRRGGEDVPGWSLVLARVEQAEANHQRVLDVLRPLVPLWEPVEDRMRPLAIYARSAGSVSAAPAERAVLRFALGSLPQAIRERDRQQFGEIAYLTADLYRMSGERDVARELYALAEGYLESGPFLAPNLYWMGNLDPVRAEARVAWQRASDTAEAEKAQGSEPWRALARGQLGVSRMLELLGRARKHVEPGPTP